eukprot:8502369-Pyramimonas_sp.AAC.1
MAAAQGGGAYGDNEAVGAAEGEVRELVAVSAPRPTQPTLQPNQSVETHVGVVGVGKDEDA